MTEDEMAGWHHRLDGHEFECAAPGKSGLHARGEGERVLALESRDPSPTHTVSLSPGPLPSCLPYRGAPFSHHRPQTHVCKVHEDDS